MKQLITLLIAVMASVTMTQAEILKKVQIDDLYYNLDTENQTAEVAGPIDVEQTEVTIPTSVSHEDILYSVTGIGKQAFYHCINLSSVSIPDGILYIESGAFDICFELSSISIPATLTSIEGRPFYGCLSMLSIDVAPENITFSSIDGVLFTKDQTKLIRYPAGKVGAYIIPDHVTSIEKDAFALSWGLTSVVIPNSITRIEENTFYLCDTLASVTLPGKLTAIERFAFNSCVKLESITIPESVTFLGHNAFSQCINLKEVYIPANVSYIGNEDGVANGTAFSNCEGLTSINVSPDNDNFCSIDGVLFSKDKKTLWQFPGGRKGEYTIPYGTTKIGAYAFYKGNGIQTLTIPSSVTNVQPMSLAFCANLDSVTCFAAIPPSTGWVQHIGNEIFTSSPNVKLFVPTQSVEVYQNTDPWNKVTTILPISANSAEVVEITITPGVNSVDIIWPAITGADHYELVIRDENGNVFCTLIFNAEGQLTQIAFNTPANGKVPQQTQSAGFSFTVTGLDSGANYSYSIIAKDSEDNVLNTSSGSFTTQSPMAIDEVRNNVQSTKVIRNGQILILRGNKAYTITGTEVNSITSLAPVMLYQVPETHSN